LEAVVQRAIDVDPRERYQSAAEFCADLLRFMNGARVQALTPRWWRRIVERFSRGRKAADEAP
jgi:hypothetical protein